MWNPGDPLGHLLVLPYITITMQKQPQPKKDVFAKALELKVLLTMEDKAPRPAKVVVENGGNRERIMEEADEKCHLEQWGI